jgi:hypothetical protein
MYGVVVVDPEEQRSSTVMGRVKRRLLADDRVKPKKQ